MSLDHLTLNTPEPDVMEPPDIGLLLIALEMLRTELVQASTGADTVATIKSVADTELTPDVIALLKTNPSLNAIAGDRDALMALAPEAANTGTWGKLKTFFATLTQVIDARTAALAQQVAADMTQAEQMLTNASTTAIPQLSGLTAGAQQTKLINPDSLSMLIDRLRSYRSTLAAEGKLFAGLTTESVKSKEMAFSTGCNGCEIISANQLQSALQPDAGIDSWTAERRRNRVDDWRCVKKLTVEVVGNFAGIKAKMVELVQLIPDDSAPCTDENVTIQKNLIYLTGVANKLVLEAVGLPTANGEAATVTYFNYDPLIVKTFKNLGL